jgi:hypothetical protein
LRKSDTVVLMGDRIALVQGDITKRPVETITHKTVEKQLSNAYAKLDVDSRAKAGAAPFRNR